MKTIIQILDFLGKSVNIKKYENIKIHNIYQDHRICNSYDVFIALKGKTLDGHSYIQQAIQKSVAFIIVEDINKVSVDITLYRIIEVRDIRQRLPQLASWFYDHPSNNVTVFAVTGTNGKTSVTHFIAQILTVMHYKTAILGTLGNGIYPKIEKSSHTTVDILKLQSYLATYSKQNVKFFAIEVSSHAIDQNRIIGININTAIFTQLSHDHLDYHGNIENYFNIKSRLFNYPNIKSAVINQDDYYGKILYKKLKNKRNINLYSYSIKNKKADCFIKIKNTTTKNILIQIFWKQIYIDQVLLPLIGIFNVSNIAAAITTLIIQQGYNLKKIISILTKISPITGRMEIISMHEKPTVVIDYAHNSDSLKKLLQYALILKNTNSKIIIVFGCGGNRDKIKRQLMAKVAEKYANFCIITEDNNRYENFGNIAQSIITGFSRFYKNYHIIPDRKKAIKYALHHTNNNDIIILSGKGHEHYLDHKGQREYFNEKEIVKQYWDSSL